jgi:hypothetical protein
VLQIYSDDPYCTPSTIAATPTIASNTGRIARRMALIGNSFPVRRNKQREQTVGSAISSQLSSPLTAES